MVDNLDLSKYDWLAGDVQASEAAKQQAVEALVRQFTRQHQISSELSANAARQADVGFRAMDEGHRATDTQLKLAEAARMADASQLSGIKTAADVQHLANAALLQGTQMHSDAATKIGEFKTKLADQEIKNAEASIAHLPEKYKESLANEDKFIKFFGSLQDHPDALKYMTDKYGNDIYDKLQEMSKSGNFTPMANMEVSRALSDPGMNAEYKQIVDAYEAQKKLQQGYDNFYKDDPNSANPYHLSTDKNPVEVGKLLDSMFHDGKIDQDILKQAQVFLNQSYDHTERPNYTITDFLNEARSYSGQREAKGEHPYGTVDKHMHSYLKLLDERKMTLLKHDVYNQMLHKNGKPPTEAEILTQIGKDIDEAAYSETVNVDKSVGTGGSRGSGGSSGSSGNIGGDKRSVLERFEDALVEDYHKQTAKGSYHGTVMRNGLIRYLFCGDHAENSDKPGLEHNMRVTIHGKDSKFGKGLTSAIKTSGIIMPNSNGENVKVSGVDGKFKTYTSTFKVFVSNEALELNGIYTSTHRHGLSFTRSGLESKEVTFNGQQGHIFTITGSIVPATSFLKAVRDVSRKDINRQS